MATRFELWLAGSDADHMQAVAYQAWEELDRLELLLSRYDRRAEVFRLNQEAHTRAVRTEVELFAVLQDCQQWYDRTNGYFDICVQAADPDTGPVATFPNRIQLDPGNRTVYFSDAAAKIDLGGYGKGYALDELAQVIRQYGIENAFIHGGTSSALAMGEPEPGMNWQLDVRDPRNAEAKPIDQKGLRDKGFSCSAAFHPDQDTSDILNPHTGEALAEQSACWVIASTALEAEVLSTALLAMGREKADQWETEHALNGLQIGWPVFAND